MNHSTKEDNLPTKKTSPFHKTLNENTVVEIREKNKIKFDIKNKKWKVFRVSPIFNFTNNNLKFFEKKLNERMNSNKNETKEFFKSKFYLNKNVKLKNQCFEQLQVELFKNELQSAYLGVFISWSSTKPSVEGSISLPVLLVEANALNMHGVHSFLSKMFDCDIQPVTFSHYALVFFFVKLLESERNAVDVSQEQVTMEFKVPNCEDSDKIKISLNLQDIIVVFAVVLDDLKEKFEEITTFDIIWEFYNKLLNHIYKIFKLDLMYAELHKIAFPDALLTTDGQLRMSTDNAALSCFDVLKCFTPLEAVINL